MKPWKRSAVLLIAISLLACGPSAKDVPKLLEERGLEFTEVQFVERARDGDLEAVELFVFGGMPVDSVDAAGIAPLAAAAAEGHEDVVAFLLANGAQPTVAAAAAAIRHAHETPVRLLLEAGLDPRSTFELAMAGRSRSLVDVVLAHAAEAPDDSRAYWTEQPEATDLPESDHTQPVPREHALVSVDRAGGVRWWFDGEGDLLGSSSEIGNRCAEAFQGGSPPAIVIAMDRGAPHFRLDRVLAALKHECNARQAFLLAAARAPGDGLLSRFPTAIPFPLNPITERDLTELKAGILLWLESAENTVFRRHGIEGEAETLSIDSVWETVGAQRGERPVSIRPAESDPGLDAFALLIGSRPAGIDRDLFVLSRREFEQFLP